MKRGLKLTLIPLAVASMAIGTYAVAALNVDETSDPVNSTEVSKPAIESEPTAPKVEPASEIESLEPVQLEPIAEAPVVIQEPEPTKSPSTTPKEPVEPETQPRTYKFAEDMAAVGIAESDYGYVNDLLLTKDGWRRFGDNTWQMSAIVDGSYRGLSNKIGYAKRWMLDYYGTWQAAHEFNAQYGNW